MENLSLELTGMGCGGCVANVKRALNATPGVSVENVTIGTAVIAYDPARSSASAIADVLRHAGYPVVKSTPAATRAQ